MATVQRDPSAKPAMGALNFEVVAPWLFVGVWSTGFMVPRAIQDHADPVLFLVLRFSSTAVLFGLIAFAARDRWPAARELPVQLAAGVLQGIYLAGSYWAISKGLGAGLMTLIGGFQPLVTGLLAVAVLKEQVTSRTWWGLALGLIGIGFLVGPAEGQTVEPFMVLVAFGAVLALTLATLLQKAVAPDSPLRPRFAIQNLAATVFVVSLLPLIGEVRWDGASVLWLGLVWSVAVMSGCGTLLLFWMVRRGAATKASSLLILAPPLAAGEAFLLFGETLSLIQVAGFAIAISGVLLARR